MRCRRLDRGRVGQPTMIQERNLRGDMSLLVEALAFFRVTDNTFSYVAVSVARANFNLSSRLESLLM